MTDKIIMNRLSHLDKALVCLLALLTPGASTVMGLGFRVPNQDAVATGRANAFVATADNPAAIYYNPAGITQLKGHQVQAGLHNINVGVDYESPQGRSAETDFVIHPVPQLHYVAHPKDKRFAFGLGMYAPYGLGIEWPSDTGFRTLALESRLVYGTVNPVAAWQITDQLSIAAGPTFNYGEALFRQGIARPGDEFQFEGDDTDIGFNVGLLWQPHRQWSFGISYRSRTQMELDGYSEMRPSPPFPGREDTVADLRFPEILIAGVSYRPTKHWNLEVNVDWTGWEQLDALTLDRERSSEITLPLNWNNSLFYEFGVTRYLGKGYYASAGYFFSERTIPDRYFTPLVPDSDLHVGTLGFGRKHGRWSWALSYEFIAGPHREVTNSVSTSAVGESADGEYQLINHALNVSIGYRF